MWHAVYEECPQAEYTGIALRVRHASAGRSDRGLRQDQWYENHPAAPAAERAAARRHMRDTFYIDTPQWQQQVLEQALRVAQQASAGLALR